MGRYGEEEVIEVGTFPWVAWVGGWVVGCLS